MKRSEKNPHVTGLCVHLWSNCLIIDSWWRAQIDCGWCYHYANRSEMYIERSRAIQQTAFLHRLLILCLPLGFWLEFPPELPSAMGYVMWSEVWINLFISPIALASVLSEQQQRANRGCDWELSVWRSYNCALKHYLLTVYSMIFMSSSSKYTF